MPTIVEMTEDRATREIAQDPGTEATDAIAADRATEKIKKLCNKILIKHFY